MAINYNEEEFGLQLPDTNQGGITDVAFAPGSALDKQINKLNTLEQMGYPQQNLQNLKDMDMKQFKETGTPLSLPRDQYAMAISNYDQWFGPKTMTDAFGTSHNLAAVNRPDLYTGDLMAKTGQRLRDPFAPFQNEMVGPNPHDPSVYDRYGNIQMGLENPDVDPYEEQKGLAALFQNFNIDPSSWGKALKTKAKTGWNFAQQLPGMAMSALSGIPFAGQILSGLANQFEDRQLTGDIMDESGNMYSAADLNKQNALGGYYTDPARSARRRTSRIANMRNRLANDKKISDKNLHELVAQEKAQQLRDAQDAADRANIQNIQNYTGQELSGYRMSRPASERGFTGHGKSGMGRDPSDKMARGGRVRFSDGGLATLFTRRG